MNLTHWLQDLRNDFLGMRDAASTRRRSSARSIDVTPAIECLEARQVLSAVIATIGDDHGNNSSAATTIQSSQSGPTVQGNIEVWGDEDWFRFDASPGQKYRLETTLGSLPDSTLTLYSKDGQSQIDFNDDYNYPSSYASRIDFTAPRFVVLPVFPNANDFTYFVKVKAYSGKQTGTYSLKLTATPVDDHGNTPETATRIQPGQSIPGNIEVGGDEDWFRFDAVAGQSYRLAATLGSLPDMTLTLYSTDGRTRIGYNAGYNGTYNTRLDWTASNGGTFGK